MGCFISFVECNTGSKKPFEDGDKSVETQIWLLCASKKGLDPTQPTPIEHKSDFSNQFQTKPDRRQALKGFEWKYLIWILKLKSNKNIFTDFEFHDGLTIFWVNFPGFRYWSTHWCWSALNTYPLGPVGPFQFYTGFLSSLGEISSMWTKHKLYGEGNYKAEEGHEKISEN